MEDPISFSASCSFGRSHSNLGSLEILVTADYFLLFMPFDGDELESGYYFTCGRYLSFCGAFS